MADEVVGSFRIAGDNYTKLLDTAKSKGLNIGGNFGQTEYDGITFGYNYDGTILTINVIKKPFYITYSEISNHLNQLYHEAYNG